MFAFQVFVERFLDFRVEVKVQFTLFRARRTKRPAIRTSIDCAVNAWQSRIELNYFITWIFQVNWHLPCLHSIRYFVKVHVLRV